MFFSYTSKFERNFLKLSKKNKARYDKRIDLFLNDEYNPILNNHKLHGEFSEYRSINITSDMRVIYKKTGKDIYLFYDIGTHSQLYS